MSNVLGLERDFLIEALQNFALLITFRKVDGTLREMRCTLNFSLVPVSEKNALLQASYYSIGSGKTRSLDTIAVYDLDRRGWRSFKIDSLETAEFLKGIDSTGIGVSTTSVERWS